MLAERTEQTGDTTNRRAHPRFRARELRGLRTARVKYGPPVSVIDLSSGGVLFETEAELQPDSTIVLEFSGSTRTFLVPSRVLRCQHLATIDDRVRSEGACVFRRPLPIHELIGPTPPSSPASEPETTWQHVVGRYRDGRVVRGYTDDFSPMKPYLHVSPAPLSEDSQFVSLIQLDALFFLRDDRGIGDDEPPGAATAVSHGRRVALTLPNGKELVGSTLNYSREASGFFVHPIDRFSGAVRVFVTQSGIRNVRFL